MTVVVFDVETTGTPLWNSRLDDPAQPRIIQLAAQQFTRERRIIGRLTVLMKRDGWVSAPNAKSAHMISEAMSDRYGVRQMAALATFMDMVRGSLTIVSFGSQFMRTMMHIELLRTGGIPPEWDAPMRNHLCVKTAAQQAFNGGRSAKIDEAHKLVLGEDFVHRFDAEEDCGAAARIYWSLVDQGKIS